MSAMGYEYLLRRVYQCDRFEIEGADADIYRRYDLAERHTKDSNWNKTTKEKERDSENAFLEVEGYIRKAIYDGLQKIKYKATKEDIEMLEKIKIELYSLGFKDKKRLEHIIKEAGSIFNTLGLEIV